MSDQKKTERGAADQGPGPEDSSLFERVVPDGFKRRIETGMENMLREGRLKNIVGEMKLPKEAVNYLMSQMDETKHAALKIVAKETRIFLEKTNLSEELAKLLTQISFEIKTQVRFVPNDKPFKKGDKLKMEVDGPKIKGRRDKHASDDTGDEPPPREEEEEPPIPSAPASDEVDDIEPAIDDEKP